MNRAGGRGRSVVDDLTPLERELREALRVEPSAEFLPRVRERLAREEATGRSSWANWLLPAAAAITVAAAVLVAHRWPQPRVITPLQEAEPRSTATTSLPPSPPGSPPRLAAAPAVGSARRAATPAMAYQDGAHSGTAIASPGTPAILVPPGGELALQHFVDSIRGLHVGGETVLSAAADTLAPDPLLKPAAAWSDAEGRVRHVDEVGWRQLEPAVMNN